MIFKYVVITQVSHLKGYKKTNIFWTKLNLVLQQLPAYKEKEIDLLQFGAR